MAAEQGHLRELAAAISDGVPIDWLAVESSAATPEERALVQQLRVLANVAEIHRHATPAEGRERQATGPGVQETAETATAPPMVETPTEWAHLRILAKVGTGTFGTVYRAWDSRLSREVALKLLHRRESQRPGVPTPLLEEARLLARVRHPNVVTIYGADRVDDRVGLWMEFLRGRTLKQLILDHGLFGPREAALIGAELCSALAAVHQTGLVHRDLKAQNVMREEGGRIVLMDFGTGEEIVDSEESPSQRLVGTPLYMAPELFRQQKATPQSDIYSLGVVLYHLVTGSYPVSGRTLVEVGAAHARGEMKRLRDARPDLSAAFVQVVDRALEHDLKRRYESAGAMEADLAKLLEPSTATPGTPHLVPKRFPPGIGEDETTATAVGSAGVEGARVTPHALPQRSMFLAGGLIALAATVLVALALAGVLDRLFRRGTPRPIQTIAVLPFVNLTGDPNQEYFADAMTDLLIANLSQISALKVISRTSVMSYKGAKKPLPEIARALRADALVEGSMTRSGNRARLTVQVIEAGTDLHLWAHEYEGDLRELFALHGAAARDIAQGIDVRLTPQEAQRLASIYQANPEAQDAYLRGRTYLNTFTAEGARKAVDAFTQAVRLDPKYAVAYAGLATGYMTLGEGFGGLSREEAYARTRDAAGRALEIDNNLAAAHVTLAMIKFYFDWDWGGAEVEFKRALELNPSDANGHQQYGWYLAARERLDDALREMRQGRELDPLTLVRRTALAGVLFYARRYDEAVKELQETLKIDPNFIVAHTGLVRTYAATRKFDQAIAELQKTMALGERRPANQAELCRLYVESGRSRQARTLLLQLNQQRQRGVRLGADNLAYIYVALGDLDRAFALLETAANERAPGMLWLKVEPRLDRLRQDPRFAALAARLGL